MSLWIKEGAKSGFCCNVKAGNVYVRVAFLFRLILAPLLLCSFIPQMSVLLLSEVFRTCVNGPDVLSLQLYSRCR